MRELDDHRTQHIPEVVVVHRSRSGGEIQRIRRRDAGPDHGVRKCNAIALIGHDHAEVQLVAGLQVDQHQQHEGDPPACQQSGHPAVATGPDGLVASESQQQQSDCGREGEEPADAVQPRAASYKICRDRRYAERTRNPPKGTIGEPHLSEAEEVDCVGHDIARRIEHHGKGHHGNEAAQYVVEHEGMSE